MEIFYVIAGVTVLGILFVVWSLMNDKGGEEQATKIETFLPEHVFNHNKLHEIDLSSPKESKAEADKSELSGLLKKAPKDKSGTASKGSKVHGSRQPSLFKKLFKSKELEVNELYEKQLNDTLHEQLGINHKKENSFEVPLPAKAALTGTEALKASPSTTDPVLKSAVLSKAEEKKIETEINSSLDLADLKMKFQRTEKLLKERTVELEEVKHSLDSEVRNRKEFNKVKDLLEKELAETKDKSRKGHNELMSTQTESESSKKRIAQLEEKVKGLEKQVYEKEKEVEDISKRLNQQPPASSLPKSSLKISEVPEVFIRPTPAPVLAPAEVKVADVTPKAAIDESLKDPWTAKTEGAPSQPIINVPPVSEPPVRRDEESSEEPASEPKSEFLSLKPDVISSPDNKNNPPA